MPSLTNNSLAGFNLRAPNSLHSSLLPAVSIPSTVGRSAKSNGDVSLVDVSPNSSAVVTSVVEASSSSTVCFSAPFVVPASQCSLAGSLVSSSAVVPLSHSFSSSPSSSAPLPLPYTPHLPWPPFSLVSPSLLFTSPPSCHLGPVPACSAPSLHSVHQQAPLSSIHQ